jgi:signal transduction histidine kinase
VASPCDDRAVDVTALATGGRWRFGRSTDDRVVLGVAGGLGARLGVPPTTVRILLAFLAVVSGVGVVLYLVAFALSDGRAATTARPEPRRQLSLSCFAAALALVLRSVGLWPGDAIVLPAAAVAAGALLLWSRAQPTAGDPLDQVMAGRYAAVRMAAGVALAAGAFVALAAEGGLDRVPRSLAALALAAGAATMIAGPWFVATRRQALSAQREQIRSEEKAAVAAHVHDSVLQSLALIQRAGDDPRRVAVLARRQERELRSWLYGDQRAQADTLAAAVERMTTDLELDHQVRIDCVVVGDRRIDDTVTALVGALREAVVNAAKHADVPAVGVYVEVEPSGVTAFVRDTGVGFDPAAVPSHRRGVPTASSGRLEHVGGAATITTVVGQGTEIELRIPA